MMATITEDSVEPIDSAQLLNQVAQLDTTTLERFAAQTSSLLAQRKARHLPHREALLLQQINRGLPIVLWERYHVLHDKLLDRTLTTEEHQEFGMLVDQIEDADVERLGYLIELAQLRNVSLDTVMEQLGIRRNEDG